MTENMSKIYKSLKHVDGRLLGAGGTLGQNSNKIYYLTFDERKKWYIQYYMVYMAPALDYWLCLAIFFPPLTTNLKLQEI